MQGKMNALGGSPITEVGSVEGEEGNPASLAGLDGAVTLAYSRLPAEMERGRFMAALAHSRVTLGVRFHFLNYGEIPESKVGQGMTGRTFTANELLWGVRGAGKMGSHLRWGVGINLLMGSIGERKSWGWGGEGGIVYDPQWQRVRFGLVLRNLGRVVDSYGSEPEAFRREWVGGFSKKLEHLPLTLHFALYYRGEGNGEWGIAKVTGEKSLSFSGGGEFEINPSEGRGPGKEGISGGDEPGSLYLRLGYRSARDQLRVGHRSDTLAGLSLGIGMRTRLGLFDYAYASWGVGGEMHSLGWTYQKGR